MEKEVCINISRDKMKAILSVSEKAKLTLPDILQKMDSMGICFGIDNEAVLQALDRRQREFVVARGNAAINGTDAYLVYHVQNKTTRQPTEREDGTVDYKNLDWILEVKEGDLLAEKIPATKGESGTDIFGNELKPKQGKDVRIQIGKNVSLQDEYKIVASSAGQFEVVNGKINVNSVLVINGDIDFSTGNIDFKGSLLIKGSVAAGFTVKATGDIDVQGIVDGGSLQGQNIIVRKGIIGNASTIQASQNITVRFIENATLIAGGNVTVGDFVMHSQVSAGQTVIVQGKRGLIVGGRISASREIVAKTVGNPMSTPTELEVGVNPILRDEYKDLVMKLEKLNTLIDEATKAINLFRGMNAEKMSTQKQEMFAKLTRTYYTMLGEVTPMRNRLSEIEKAFLEIKNGKIKVMDTTYPGVIITIGTKVKQIQSHMKFATFYVDERDIVIGPYQ